VESEHDGETAGALRQALIAFGVSSHVSERLVSTHPPAHIQAKLDQAEWLVATQSPAVRRNPAGWLRRAIEEDYAPPPGYPGISETEAETGRLRQLAESSSRLSALARGASEAEAGRLDQSSESEASARWLVPERPANSERRNDLDRRPHTPEADPPPAVAPKLSDDRTRRERPGPAALNSGATRATQRAWDRARELLNTELSPLNRTLLKDCALLSLDGGRAVLGTPDRTVQGQIQARLKPRLEKALSQVAAQEVRLAIELMP
jgi:hypothetical protein